MEMRRPWKSSLQTMPFHLCVPGRCLLVKKKDNLCVRKVNWNFEKRIINITNPMTRKCFFFFLKVVLVVFQCSVGIFSFFLRSLEKNKKTKKTSHWLHWYKDWVLGIKIKFDIFFFFFPLYRWKWERCLSKDRLFGHIFQQHQW